MSLLVRLYPGDAAVLFAASLIVYITVIIVVGWGLAILLARRSAALRHTIWLVTLVAVVLSPVATLLARHVGVALVTVPLSAGIPVLNGSPPPQPDPQATRREISRTSDSGSAHREAGSPAVAPSRPYPSGREHQDAGSSTEAPSRPFTTWPALVGLMTAVWAVVAAGQLLRLVLGWRAVRKKLRAAGSSSGDARTWSRQ